MSKMVPSFPVATAVALASLVAGGCDASKDHPAALVGVSALPAFAQTAGHPVEPTPFAPGVVSTPDREQYRVTFTPDGRTVYFAAGDAFFPISRQATIYYSTFEDGTWTEPRVASFSGRYSDIDPFISPDGRRLYFSSIRPVNGEDRTDSDLWMVERVGDGWSEPIHLGDSVNSRFDELYPGVTADGTLVFGSQRPGGTGGDGDWDIYVSRPVDGVYGPAENAGPSINSPYWDFNPWISADGRTLLFTSLWRPDGLGYGDLYVSHLHRGEWTSAANLGAPVNSALDDYHATVSPDGRMLYFLRHDYAPWTPGSVYQIPVAALGNRLRPGYTVPDAAGRR